MLAAGSGNKFNKKTCFALAGDAWMAYFDYKWQLLRVPHSLRTFFIFYFCNNSSDLQATPSFDCVCIQEVFLQENTNTTTSKIMFKVRNVGSKVIDWLSKWNSYVSIWVSLSLFTIIWVWLLFWNVVWWQFLDFKKAFYTHQSLFLN